MDGGAIWSGVAVTYDGPGVDWKWTWRTGRPSENAASSSRRSVCCRGCRSGRLAAGRRALVLVVEHVLDADLLLDLADEVLLAGDAHEVGVGVAVAHVVERRLAAQLLVAGLDVDVAYCGGGQPGILVVVAAVDVDVDAADRVDDAAEALEVDVDDVVDRDPGSVCLTVCASARRRRSSTRR